MPRRQRKNPIDWSAIRLDFETNGGSLRSLGRRHGCSGEQIRKVSISEGWARRIEAVAPIPGDVMALSRGLAVRVLSELTTRKAGISEIDEATSVLKNLAVAARAFGEAPAVASAEMSEPTGPASGKKELQRDAAEKIGRVGRYATPPTPPKLVVIN